MLSLMGKRAQVRKLTLMPGGRFRALFCVYTDADGRGRDGPVP